ncbi:DNA pilot protein [Microviridae sp.]|nr:DNA pilot protein [Microviridae sp.]
MGLGSALGGLASFGLSAASAVASQKQQYRYSKKERQQGPSWDVAGLRKAGLNPILAAGVRGGSSHGVAPMSAADVAKSAEAYSSSSAKDSQGKLMKKQKELTDEQINTEISKQNVNSALSEKTRNEAYSAMVDAKVREKSGNLQMSNKLLQWSDAINKSGGFGAINSAKGLVDAFNPVRNLKKNKKR